MTPDAVARMVANLIRPLHRRVMLMAARGVLHLTSDAEGQQRMQVSLLEGEVRDAVDRVQQYGLSAYPTGGSSVLVLCIGGNRDHPVILAVDDPRTRPTGLNTGEVVVYSVAGQRILLRQDEGLEITTAAGAKIEIAPDQTITMQSATKVRLETPLLEVTGDIRDQADGAGRTMGQMREAYDVHGHPDAAPPPSPLMGDA